MSKKYPDGKLRDDDDGATPMQIGVEDGHLVIDFGKSIRWIGFDAESARKLIDLLQKHVRELPS